MSATDEAGRSTALLRELYEASNDFRMGIINASRGGRMEDVAGWLFERRSRNEKIVAASIRLVDAQVAVLKSGQLDQ